MLIRQTLRYLPAQVLAPAFQLLSMVAWTYWLTPNEMGAYVLISATQEFVYLFALSWFSIYALRFMPFDRGRRERSEYLHTEAAIVALSLPVSLAAAIATVLVVGDHAFSWQTVWTIAFFFATRGTNVHYSERARAQSNILAYTILQIVGPVAGFGLGLLLLREAPTSDMLLLAYGIAQAVASLIAAPMIGVSLVPRRIARSLIHAAFGYGGPLLILFGLGWIAENNFRYIVENVSGAAAFGLMAVGWGLGRRCASFGCMLVAAAAFPIAARLLNEGRRTEARLQLSANAALLVGVMAPTVAGLAIIAAPATDLLVAEPYREMTRAILGLAALGGAFRFLHVHVTDQLFVLERRFRFAGIVDVIEIAATIALTLAGLLWHGPVGAVIGSAAGSLIATSYSFVLAMRRLDFVVPVGHIARILAATAVMVGGLLLLPPATTILGLVGVVLAGMVLYGAAIAIAYRGYVRDVIGRRLSRRAEATA